MLFLVAYMVITKRTLESLVLACILAFVMLEKGRFVIGVYGGLLTTLSDGDTASILLSIALIGGLSRLLSRAGGVGALNKAVSLRIKSRAGVLICGLLCVVVLFIDDYLGLMVAGVCFIPLADARRVPREMSGFVIGSPTEAVSTLVPLSVWSVFLAGLITAAGGGGFTLYLSSIPFNFTSLLTVCLCALAALGKLPLLGGMKAAQARVDRGEALWPSGSEQYLSEENLNMRGSVMNILAPLLVLIGASIGLGVLESGRFSVNIGSGLIATLLFLFPFYCLQRIFTPEAFFDELTAGIEGMITPILMLLMTMLFTLAIDALGFSDVLAHFVPLLLGGRFEWLPAALFAVFALIAALLGSSWSMYTIAIPVAVALAAPVGGWAAPLFIGAVCAAGIAGDSLSAYHSDSFLTASVIGLNPLAYYTSKLPYALIAAGLSLALYIGIGFWVL
jgi:Na+/H+ antiporter NhaC